MGNCLAPVRRQKARQLANLACLPGTQPAAAADHKLCHETVHKDARVHWVRQVGPECAVCRQHSRFGTVHRHWTWRGVESQCHTCTSCARLQAILERRVCPSSRLRAWGAGCMLSLAWRYHPTASPNRQTCRRSRGAGHWAVGMPPGLDRLPAQVSAKSLSSRPGGSPRGREGRCSARA